MITACDAGVERNLQRCNRLVRTLCLLRERALVCLSRLQPLLQASRARESSLQAVLHLILVAIDKVLYPLHVRHGRFRGTELPPALIQRCLRLLELLLLISQGVANLMQLALCAQVFCLDRLYLLPLTRQGLGIRLRLRLHMLQACVQLGDGLDMRGNLLTLESHLMRDSLERLVEASKLDVQRAPHRLQLRLDRVDSLVCLAGEIVALRLCPLHLCPRFHYPLFTLSSFLLGLHQARVQVPLQTLQLLASRAHCRPLYLHMRKPLL